MDMPTSPSLPAVYPRAVPHRMEHAYARGPSAVNVNETVDLRLRETRGRKRGPSAPSPPQARRDAGPRARVAGVARGISRFAVARWQFETETEFEAEAFVVIRMRGSQIV